MPASLADDINSSLITIKIKPEQRELYQATGFDISGIDESGNLFMQLDPQALKEIQAKVTESSWYQKLKAYALPAVSATLRGLLYLIGAAGALDTAASIYSEARR